MFCSSGPNLVILAWTGDKLSRGQTSDYRTHRRTHRQTQATTIPKGQNWPRVTIGHLFYATSSFVHHFVAIGEFELELESGNAQSGSNSMLFRALWPWNLMDDLKQGKSEGFDSCARPSNLAQIWPKSSIFQLVWPWNLMYDLEK